MQEIKNGIDRTHLKLESYYVPMSWKKFLKKWNSSKKKLIFCLF